LEYLLIYLFKKKTIVPIMKVLPSQSGMFAYVSRNTQVI